MAQTDQELTKNYWVKPLTFATPLLKDESIASWLIRAALNSGCSPLAFTGYYWSEYRLWNCDVDKGFNHLDPHIHHDIAVLAKTTRQTFDEHTLLAFANNKNKTYGEKVALPWTLPLSMRNRYARYGYAYCPLCLKDNESAHLKLLWRLSWSVCCIKHEIPLKDRCPHCNELFQPQFAKPENRYLNYCYCCNKSVGDVKSPDFSNESAILVQDLAERVWRSGQGKIIGETVSKNDWFEALQFFINIVRRGLLKPEYMFGKFLIKIGVKMTNLMTPKTKLRFDRLPQTDRSMLLGATYPLLTSDKEQWLKACQELNMSQNSFKFGSTTIIPDAFMPVYLALPTNNRNYSSKKGRKSMIKSPESVMSMWYRLERKMEIMDGYERHKSCISECWSNLP